MVAALRETHERHDSGASTYLPLGGNLAYQVREVAIELDPERLRSLAAERGMRLRDLARAVETTRSGLANWMAGTRQLKTEKALELARVLDADVEAFCRVRGVR